jgi:predicted PolB exonuclease-like 3'-5' exonuclease
VRRVPATDVEALVIKSVREHLKLPSSVDDRSLVTTGLSARPYFHRYTDDAMDLCDVLSSFAPQAKSTLHELCRVMELPGKPDEIHGGDVEKYFHDGRIKEIADYCESDVVNTYRVWLRYELFRGKLTNAALQASEANLSEFITRRNSRVWWNR